MSKYKINIFNVIEKFHADNLYIPTRTIYFGKNDIYEDNPANEINYATAGQLIKNLHILDGINQENITLLLNTPGGNWEDGMAIYDIIKKIKSKVIIIGMGKIYSMGSVVLQAGYKRWLMPNTYVMIHDGYDGFIGDTKSYEAWAKIAKDIRNTMYKIYYRGMKKKNFKITIKDIENMCSHDKIFTASEAVEIGLADKVL